MAVKKAKAGAKSAAKKAAKATVKKAKSPAKKSAKKGASKTKASAPQRAAALKLNDRQREYLKKVHAAGETGYTVGPSYEQRTIDALVERKLVKRGAKDKSSGKNSFTLTKAGQKQLTVAPSPTA